MSNGTDPNTSAESYKAWHECAKLIRERDDEKIGAWSSEIDGFLNFSSIFCGVITFFLSQTYTNLQPNYAQDSAEQLREISRQLASQGSDIGSQEPGNDQSPAPFQPMLSDVVLNCLLFTSLFASLIACGKGLWVKEWLREYHLDLPHSPRDLIRTRQLRYQGLQMWSMRRIIAAISFFLQLSVTLFAIALVVAVWNIHPFLRYTLTALCVLWVFMTAFTAICPLFSIRCPFKSPLARAVFRIASWVRRAFTWITHLSSYNLYDTRKPSEEEYAMGETLEKREMKFANNLDGWRLDIEALEYVNHEWWGNDKLQHINEAFKDVSRVGVDAAKEVRECIDRIIASRALGNRGIVDEGVERLQEIREEL